MVRGGTGDQPITNDISPEAPDRIWASPEHPDENGYGGFWIAAKVAPSVEYVRADLLAEAQAENARLRCVWYPSSPNRSKAMPLWIALLITFAAGVWLGWGTRGWYDN